MGDVSIQEYNCESVRMMSSLRCLDWRSIALVGLLGSGSIALNGCGKANVGQNQNRLESAAAPAAEMADSKSVSKPDAVANKSVVPIPQKPQLIRTADLSLRLESIDKIVVEVRRIVQAKQGDIYNFQDDRPQGNGEHRRATLVLKVPSAALDDTLTEIIKLGRVESQSIKSEDVTQQLVDTDARLKNLRQQEDLTRKIMDRSGSVKDILAVSQQLSQIREQIEQLDASVKNLRQQVGYSTINLKVEEVQSGNLAGDGFGVQVGETWKNSTHSAGSLATNLALTLLWLLPFTPFIAIGAGGVYYVMRRRRRQLPVVEIPRNEE
jgi:archaellum component FlaC